MEMKAVNSFSSKAKELPVIAIPLKSSDHVQQTEPEKVTSSSPSPLASTPNAKNCLCSPTTHAGSFRCRLHRSLQKQWSIGSYRLPSPPPEEVQVPSTETVPKPVEENWVA